MRLVKRIQINISSNDELSISNGSEVKYNCTMRLRKGMKCYVLTGTAFCLVLICYVADLTYVSSYLNNKVPVHRLAIRWADHESKIDHSKPRIMITYNGRMGNHLFQYATLMGISQRYNMTPIIPPDIDFLDVFNIPTLQGTGSLLRNPKKYSEEKAAHYYKGVEHIDPKSDAYLIGFYQSWKYFDHIRNDLLDKYLILHDTVQDAALRYIQNVLETKKLKGANVVAIHVRRGDFVRQRVKGFTVAPIPYYYKAMAYFRKKYKKILFIICTNDLMWAETNLDDSPDVHFSHETDAALDFGIMINSNHIIITSGSFSWWAGYLVRGEVVYYEGYPQPNTIIGNITLKADYYPPYWKGIS